MGSKRGRDGDDAGVGWGAVPAATDDRVRKMHAHRRALNEQFLTELTRKMRANPAGVFEKEAADYVKYSKNIRVRRQTLMMTTMMFLISFRSPPGKKHTRTTAP